jgi:hypothetical protein
MRTKYEPVMGNPAAEATVMDVCAAVVAVGRVVVFGLTW